MHFAGSGGKKQDSFHSVCSGSWLTCRRADARRRATLELTLVLVLVFLVVVGIFLVVATGWRPRCRGGGVLPQFFFFFFLSGEVGERGRGLLERERASVRCYERQERLCE